MQKNCGSACCGTQFKHENPATSKTGHRYCALLIGRFGRRRDYLRVSVMDMLKIAGSDSYASIMAGQQAGKQVGFKPIKLNMVVMRSVNDHKI